ncbi:MAG: hypothetical protein U5K69_15910 [Balneolaceae bacterium]|nr:hypothetical protein [Balneolaceae bacterium]
MMGKSSSFFTVAAYIFMLLGFTLRATAQQDTTSLEIDANHTIREDVPDVGLLGL